MLYHIVRYSYDVIAPKAGYITHMNTEQCGIASVMLGVGRTIKDGPIDYSAGIIMHKKTGDAIIEGESIAILYASDESLLANAAKTYIEAITIGEEVPRVVDTILDIVE